MLRLRLGGSGGRQLQRRPLRGGSQQPVGLHAVERLLEKALEFLLGLKVNEIVTYRIFLYS